MLAWEKSATNFSLVPLLTDPITSESSKSLLLDQTPCLPPWVSTESDSLISFSNYGLQLCLKELDKEEFQRFKQLLQKHGKSTLDALPWAQVDEASTDGLAALLHEYCDRERAWTICIDIFQEMELLMLSEKAREEMRSKT